jgi:hypothetical protein
MSASVLPRSATVVHERFRDVVHGALCATGSHFQPRLLTLENGRVTFAWKDYADGNQSKTMTLDAVEFIRRFLLHVLASGLVRIRHFGFLANRKRKQKLALCRALLPVRQTATEPNTKTGEQEPRRCPISKAGQLLFIEILTPEPLACLPKPLIADTS